MTCPHCGAEARQQERFCPRCSRLIDSPLLTMRQELDAARAAILRDRPAPLARTLAKPATPAVVPPALTGPAMTGPPRGSREKRKAGVRARLAVQGAPPPPPPREAHSAEKHATVPDDTLQQALRGQGAPASAALEQARQQARAQQAAPQATQPRAAPSQSQPGRQADRKPPPSRSAQPAAPAARGKPDAQARPRRTTSAITVMLLFNLTTLALAWAGPSWLAAMPEGSLGHGLSEPLNIVSFVLAGAVALATLGLAMVRPFGRGLQRALALLWLPLVPFGTLFAFASYVYLGTRGVRLLFSSGGEPPPRAADAELLARTRKYAPLVAVLVFLLGVLAWSSLLALAASLKPQLVQPGSVAGLLEPHTAAPAEEPIDLRQAMLSDLENFAIKQLAYARANGGFFDRTECLVSNACVTGQTPLASPLEPRFLDPVRSGYEFRLRLGTPPDSRGAGISSTSVTAFTYLALPAGAHEDPFGYCVDRTVVICRFPAGAAITSPPGECPAGCEFVR